MSVSATVNVSESTTASTVASLFEKSGVSISNLKRWPAIRLWVPEVFIVRAVPSRETEEIVAPDTYCAVPIPHRHFERSGGLHELNGLSEL